MAYGKAAYTVDSVYIWLLIAKDQEGNVMIAATVYTFWFFSLANLQGHAPLRITSFYL